MPEILWRLLLVMVTIVAIVLYVQDGNRNQSLDEERLTSCLTQRDKLSEKASQLQQQVTQMKEQHPETDRALTKLAALEENLKKLEGERIALGDERDRLLIREKHLKQQHDDCRSQLEEIDSDATEERDRRLNVEEDLEERTRELLRCHLKTLTQERLLLGNARPDSSATGEVPATGNDGYAAYPVLVKTFKTKKALTEDDLINGIAMLNGDIFAVTIRSNVIERFDSMTLSTQQTLTMLDFESLQGIQSCNRSKLLFILEKDSTSKTFIAAVDPYNLKLIDTWAVDSQIKKLSVTEDCHVVVAFPDDNKIHEYSSTGHLIQEIVLEPEMGIAKPRFALKMSNGNFLVSYDGINRKAGVGLAILNSKGHVLKSYSDPSQDKEYVNALAIDRLGNILVAQMISGRVVLLSSDLEYKRELVSREYGIGVIRALLLDEVNGRLFVVDCNFNMQGSYFENSRILVFDMQQ